MKMQYNAPQYVQNIVSKVFEQIKNLKRSNLDVLESKQQYLDEVLQIYKKALDDLIDKTVGSSSLLRNIKSSYDDALAVRNERIRQFNTQDRVFGISANKNKWDNIIKKFTKENDDLREANRQLRFENTKLMKDMGKTKDNQFSDYLLLMRERDARYTLYFENVALHLKLKELDGSCRSYTEDLYGDPVVLRIALDRCREQLSSTQAHLKRMIEDYSETVPRRDFDALETKYCDLDKTVDALRTEYGALQNAYRRVVGQKKCTEEELSECREWCRELERSGTPRPLRWELCADFIGGGRDRWRQLASGLSSRERLLVLLKELGPAAESEHLEYFDGLGTDPAVPAYLRHEGRVRNLRLSRRELRVIVNDIWLSKRGALAVPMQDYVTTYFEERYQQATVRAEWAYNVCAGAQQALDEPAVRLWWGALAAGLDEALYWGLRRHWTALRDACARAAGSDETISLEECERVTRALFPLKSEVDVKNLMDAVRRQLKLRLNNTDVHLEKLFYENEEGFDRTELVRELHRQRQQALDKYLRELLAELAPRTRRQHAAHAPRTVTVDALKRAFAIIDPAIDHVRMEKYIRWAFSDQTSDLSSINPLPLRTVVTRLAAGDIERIGPRQKGARKIKI